MSRKIIKSTSFLITISLSFLLIFFTVFSALSQYNRYQSYLLQKSNVDALISINYFREAVTESLDAFLSYTDSLSSYKIEDYYKANKRAKDMLEEIRLISSEDAAFTLSSIEHSLNSYIENANSTIEYLDFDSPSYLTTSLKAEMIASYILAYSDDLVSIVIDSNTESLAEDSRSYSLFFIVNIAFLALFAAILCLIIFVFSKDLRRPIAKLSETAERIASGDLSARADIKAADNQVMLLTETFNDMADDILKMMEDLKMKTDAERKLLEEQKKNIEVQAQLDRATFLALQTQTNPHFLFNTLNSIDRTIQLGKNEDARMMLHSISTLMRYNLTDGSAPAVLREEIDATKEYLKIQKIRFSSRLEYSIEINEDLLDTILLPRFTLQPLVENAIIHGLKEKEREGLIEIKCLEADDYILLTVFDNGKGMSDEKIEECMNREVLESKHIGISNTKHRLELFTGSKDALHIESKIGEWTKIIIKLGR